jgi:hypothetical protein
VKNHGRLAFIAVFMLLCGAVFAQDLKIDYVLDLAPGATTSYFTFTGPIRYMAVDKDHVDAATGASVKNSTELFQSYLVDVKGKNALPNALRGLFLYAVGAAKERAEDDLTVAKAADGAISVRYVHRGIAYELVTDTAGKLVFPDGKYRKRVIGFIVGEGPQVIHRDFSSDGTTAKVDWSKAWNAGIAGGKEIAAGNATKTGDIGPDTAVADSMYYWEGALQATFDKNVLKISGGLNAVKR